MSPRKQAKENGKKYYMTFCRSCNRDTEHYVSNHTCEPCHSARNCTPDAIAWRKNWYQDNKEHVSIYYAQYNQDNIERLSAYRIQYYLDNKEQRKNKIRRTKITPLFFN